MEIKGTTLSKKGLIITISGLVIITVLIFASLYIHDGKKDNSQISLEIELVSQSIDLNQSTSITIVIKNTGSEKAHIFFPWWYITQERLIVKNETGQEMHLTIDFEPPPEPDNDDVLEIDVGGNITRTIVIQPEYWSLTNGENYTIQFRYFVSDLSGISVPYWEGEIYSNIVELEIR